MTAGVRYFAFSNLFLVALCVYAWTTPPQGSVGADALTLGLTYGVVLAALGGVFGALRLIRKVDGEMDWGGIAPAPVAASIRSVPTTA